MELNAESLVEANNHTNELVKIVEKASMQVDHRTLEMAGRSVNRFCRV